ncbi:hypothetical protein DAPPUDRAFT_323029 [Daphnia pulex]|uniref:Uncharacterized protein n=1 Tax=Daphnia pulex TaxID=6669 RepID=E9GXQ4_DAPPU|nr:hypothetical protein DAPPUDRAFT_323029 [Daphnia pulex]|eukprot:EFX75774.1 hypothetical protein DAPPUDRAFT_323029 [Daphnia pulex]
MKLFKYGGSSHIRRLVDSTAEPLVPKPKGSVWNCQLVLKNQGNLAGYVSIQPLQENGKVLGPYHCMVMPQCCSVGVGDIKNIKIFIYPSEDGEVDVTFFKLRLVWGDEPLRARWIRCIADGAPVTPNTKIN